MCIRDRCKVHPQCSRLGRLRLQAWLTAGHTDRVDGREGTTRSLTRGNQGCDITGVGCGIGARLYLGDAYAGIDGVDVGELRRME